MGPSLEIIHYQRKTCTTNFYSKQVLGDGGGNVKNVRIQWCT